MPLSSVLKSGLKSLGLRVVTTGHAGSRYLDVPPSGPFEEILLRTFSTLEGLRFIQVGANDGQRADPIQELLRRFHWSGLLIEPLPAFMAALKRNHEGNPRLAFLQAAIDVTEGTRSIFQLRPGAQGAPDWAWGLASFDRERVISAVGALGFGPAEVIEERIPAVTWTHVWEKFGSARCDLLVVDTEGQDVRLLREADIARHRPRVIHFEHACVGAAERLAFYGELIAWGYEIATCGQDTIAYEAAAPRAG